MVGKLRRDSAGRELSRGQITQVRSNPTKPGRSRFSRRHILPLAELDADSHSRRERTTQVSIGLADRKQ